MIDITLGVIRGIAGILVMFGVAIFVHELGHFMFAKLFGVKVETFSLGFGKKIIRKQWGETEYCISIVPFGGYVKMVGTYSKELEDLASGETPASASEQAVAQEVIQELEAPAPVSPSGSIVNEVEALRSKPYYQRIIILSAGCAMNILMGFFVYFSLYYFGHNQAPDAPVVVGKVNAQHLGSAPQLLEGDTILKVNDKDIKSGIGFLMAYDDLFKKDQASSMVITLLRDNTTQTVTMPVASPFQPVIPIEQIRQMGGQPTKSDDDSRARINTLMADPATTQVYITYEDESELTREVLASPLAAAGSMWVEYIYPMRSKAYIELVLPNLPGEKAGLRIGDEIKSIDGQDVETAGHATQLIQKRGGKTVAFVVSRIQNGKLKEESIDVPIRVNPDSSQKTGQIGVQFGEGRPTQFVSYPFLQSVKMAYNQIITLVPSYVKGLKRIFTSSFQTIRENVAGPVGIAQQAYAASQQSITYFLLLFAAFNIILAITNLLPLPVLDGGHIFFLTVEKIIGRPLPARFMQFIYNLFIFLLLGMALLITFNDIIMNAWRLLG